MQSTTPILVNHPISAIKESQKEQNKAQNWTTQHFRKNHYSIIKYNACVAVPVWLFQERCQDVNIQGCSAESQVHISKGLMTWIVCKSCADARLLSGEYRCQQGERALWLMPLTLQAVKPWMRPVLQQCNSQEGIILHSWTWRIHIQRNMQGTGGSCLSVTACVK